MQRGGMASSGKAGRSHNTFHLVHFEYPQKNIKTTTETISFFVEPDGTMHADENHTVAHDKDVYKLCTLDFDPEGRGEKAVLLELRCSYVHNEFEEVFFWDVEGMFEKVEEEGCDPAGLRPAGSQKHPDSTGRTCIVVPGGGYKGLVPEANRVVYKPRLKHLDINLLPYVGLETQILHANSTCISQQGTVHDYQAYNATDPFLVFLLQHKNRFDEVNASDIKMAKTAETGHTYYLVKRPLVKRVQLFFKTLYSLILYMRKPAVEFRWRCFPKGAEAPQAPLHETPDGGSVVSPPPPPEAPLAAGGKRGRFITVVVQADYVVLSPEVIKYKAHGESLIL